MRRGISFPIRDLTFSNKSILYHTRPGVSFNGSDTIGRTASFLNFRVMRRSSPKFSFTGIDNRAAEHFELCLREQVDDEGWDYRERRAGWYTECEEMADGDIEETVRGSLPQVNVLRELEGVYWEALAEHGLTTPSQSNCLNDRTWPAQRKPTYHETPHEPIPNVSVSRSVNLHLRTVAMAIQTVLHLRIKLTSRLSSHYAAPGKTSASAVPHVKSTATLTS
jgi:hypothetical protein